MMQAQKGMSLIGLLLTGVLLGAVFLLGMKTVPALNEYAAIKRVINTVADNADPSNATVPGLRRDFDTRASIDDITSVKGADLIITKRGGSVTISVAYARRIPVVANVSLLIDFEASSTGN
ncbi:MAG: DUF4845 domain-containing protein [Rhodocyclaceae bacterium]|nr:DUF4845 domain-containing protein [Rhodocyclaceae bacterium]